MIIPLSSAMKRFFLAEFIILVPIGFSILVKAGLILRDKVSRFTGKVLYNE